jgi:hypothetical protein
VKHRHRLAAISPSFLDHDKPINCFFALGQLGQALRWMLDSWLVQKRRVETIASRDGGPNQDSDRRFEIPQAFSASYAIGSGVTDSPGSAPNFVYSRRLMTIDRCEAPSRAA